MDDLGHELEVETGLQGGVTRYEQSREDSGSQEEKGHIQLSTGESTRIFQGDRCSAYRHLIKHIE